MSDTPPPDWTLVFGSVFDKPASAVEARIWSEVLGDEYPAELDPYSFTTWSELEQFTADLAVGPEDRLVDVGCGRGGPGLWVAASTGSSYVGVDIAEAALAEVRTRAARLGLAASAATAVGAFENLPIEVGGADAVMSIDALLFTPDKQAAAHELARVLRPGGRLVLTSWDYSGQPEGRPPQVTDHRPLLRAAGFTVRTYDATRDWEQRHRAFDARLLDSVDDLAAETGQNAEDIRAELREMAATVDVMLRRVYIVAERI